MQKDSEYDIILMCLFDKLLQGVCMPEETISFTIQGDSEGYITFECPFCGSEFKLQAGEFQNDDEPFEELFCPYCGLSKGKNEFFTADVREKIKNIIHNQIAEILNKTFSKTYRTVNRSNGIIKVDFKPLKKVAVRELQEIDTAETEFNCSCCNHNVKVVYCSGASKIFCPYCGVDI